LNEITEQKSFFKSDFFLDAFRGLVHEIAEDPLEDRRNIKSAKNQLSVFWAKGKITVQITGDKEDLIPDLGNGS
jgi:hypothetical protein